MSGPKITGQSPDFRNTVARQMADYRRRMAEQIEAGLARKSISREDLARKAGVHDKTIKRLLAQDVRTPRPHTVRAIAKAIDRKPTDLWPAPSVEADQLDRIEEKLDELLERLPPTTAPPAGEPSSEEVEEQSRRQAEEGEEGGEAETG